MNTRHFALVSHSDLCVLHISCPRASGTLVHVRRAQADITAARTDDLPVGRQVIPLPPGLYHLRCDHGAAWKIEGGESSVIVLPFDGEDPWPVPPQLGYQDPFSFADALRRYLAQV